MEKKNILDRVTLPTRVIVNRSRLSPTELAAIVRKGELSPAGEEACELEAGGQVLARGKIVRRQRRYFFKVLATAEKEERS